MLRERCAPLTHAVRRVRVALRCAALRRRAQIVHWFDARDSLMVAATQTYWLAFATTGDPNLNAAAQLEWPRYSALNRTS